MASGDLTWSGGTYCSSIADMKTAVDTFNLALATDKLVVCPHRDGFIVAQVSREA